MATKPLTPTKVALYELLCGIKRYIRHELMYRKDKRAIKVTRKALKDLEEAREYRKLKGE